MVNKAKLGNSKIKKFEFLEHTGDIKFRVFGKTLAEIFENSVLAISNYLSRSGKIKAKIKKRIEVNGEDLESLFYNFIEELIYLMDAEDFVAAKAEVLVDEKNKFIRADLFGDRASSYDLDQIKAATYAEMFIKKSGYKWVAQAVLDV